MNKNDIKLIDFLNLDVEKRRMVLDWRNDNNIRQWMYNDKIISEKEHFDFIENLKNNDTKKYFLVSQDNNDIGVVYFVKITKGSTEFGLYANPSSNIPGIGRILEEVAIEYAFNDLQVKVLKLEVYSDNVRVRNLHKKYKFQETGTKTVNDRSVICMELRNENR